MKISQIDNQLISQPSFGIKYKNRNAWIPQLLKSFENTNLVKELDRKYPEAEVFVREMPKLDKISETKEKIYTVDIVIGLVKDRIFRWRYGSYNPQEPLKYFLYEFDEMTLKDMERHSVKGVLPEEKTGLIKNILSKIFG